MNDPKHVGCFHVDVTIFLEQLDFSAGKHLCQSLPFNKIAYVSLQLC